MIKKSHIIIGVVVVILLGIVFLFRSSFGFGERDTSVPIMELSNSEMQETQKGNVIWKLKAGRVSIGGDKNTATCENVEGYFKDKDMEFTVKAKYGKISRNEKTVYLEGEVRGKTSEGVELSAENLTYDGKTQKLSTDKHFTITHEGKELSADSFEADRVLETMKAKGNAKLRKLEEKH